MISKALVVGAYHGKLREMAALGVDLTVIVPHRWGSQENEIREAAEYKIRVLRCALPGHNHFHFYRAGIEPFEADVVHVDEEPWSLVTYQCIRACVKAGKPTLFFTWQNIYKTYPPPFKHFERFSFRHARAAIAGSEEAREILRARHFRKPIAVIPQFGVDPEFFRKRDVSNLKEKLGIINKFAIGYAGRIVPDKGIFDLVQALTSLPEPCVLVLMGEGEFRGETEQLARRLGVAARIQWVSHVPSLDVPNYMNAFDVLVLPSRTTPQWKEQFGRVLVEAMACETPVIGSNSAEIPNVIGNAGLVFPEGDAAALAGQLRLLCDTPDLRARFGVEGRNRVLGKFTHRRIAGETVALYHHVLMESGANCEKHSSRYDLN